MAAPSNHLIEQFLRDGFVVVPDLLTNEETRPVYKVNCEGPRTAFRANIHEGVLHMSRECYGFNEQEWQSLKDLLTDILVERVPSTAPTITYAQLVNAALSRIQNAALLAKTRDILTPHSYALGAMLGEISTDSCNKSPDHGMLSVIVVHKTGDQRPGKGFFECAVTLGRLPPAASQAEKDELWAREMDTVLRSYA